MGLRADITPQIERIANTLLKEGQNALCRLSYAGQVLRVAPSTLSPLRQLRQAGIEMIGELPLVRELEVMTAAIEALDVLGLGSMVLSLSYAGLFEVLFGGCLADSKEFIRKAIYHKDTGSLPLSTPFREVTLAFMQDPLERLLARSDIPAAAFAALTYLQELQRQLKERFPALVIHVDPLDTEGFDYHEGACFTLYDSASRQEIGRGGCYTLSPYTRGCGMTFYIERLLLSELALPVTKDRQSLPEHTGYEAARRLRDAGTVTVMQPIPTTF